MSARTDLVEALVLPKEYRVIGYQTSLDRIEVGAVVVMVYRDSVRPATQHQATTSEMSVWAITPRLNPGTADDDLDDALDVVIAALDAIPGVLWTDAERGVWADVYHGYKITLTLTTSKET